MTDLVTTRDAAAMYGCRPRSLCAIMQRNGLRPAETRVLRPGLVTYLWRPTDVLKARAVARENARRTRAKFVEYAVIGAAHRHQRSQVNRTARLERLRAFWLARAEQRRANAA